jgi:hypothetical protein
MSTKIIYAAAAILAIISNTAQAAGFSHIPTFTPPRPVFAAPRPVVNAAPTSGLTRTETIRHVGKFTEDTAVYTNANGKVVMAISSISSNPAPAAASPTPTKLQAFQHVGNTSSSSRFGGSGQAHNATNSQNSRNSTNSTNTSQAQQAHQGSNCTARLHAMKFC